MPQSNLIRTSLTLDTLRSPRRGLGRPLILSEHSYFTEEFRSVSQLAELVDLGFSTSDPAYLSLEAMLTQPGRRPLIVDIGRRETPVAQVWDFTVTGTADGNYSIQLDGTTFTFAASTSTNDQIRDGLIAAIDADPRYDAASGGSGIVQVTAAVAGVGFVPGTLSAPSPATLVGAQDTANVGIATDLAAIRGARSLFYGIELADSHSVAHEILEAARFAASDELCFVLAQSDDANILNASDSTDVASRLQTLQRLRAMTLYHDDDSSYVGAGWLGKQLPTVPGTSNWAWQHLQGFEPDELTHAQVASIKQKHANWFELLGGRAVVNNGRCADGNWIDTVIGADKLKIDIGAGLVDLFISSEIIPYDNEGIEQVRSTIEAEIRRQRFVRPETVRVTAPSLVPTDDGRHVLTDEEKANRVFTGFEWFAVLRGAVNEVDNVGTLSITDPQ
jgi:hypothetical protein